MWIVYTLSKNPTHSPVHWRKPQCHVFRYVVLFSYFQSDFPSSFVQTCRNHLSSWRHQTPPQLLSSPRICVHPSTYSQDLFSWWTVTWSWELNHFLTWVAFCQSILFYINRKWNKDNHIITLWYFGISSECNIPKDRHLKSCEKEIMSLCLKREPIWIWGTGLESSWLNLKAASLSVYLNFITYTEILIAKGIIPCASLPWLCEFYCLKED